MRTLFFVGVLIFLVTATDDCRRKADVKAPWIAALGIVKEQTGPFVTKCRVLCSGVIISKWHILTAAHCVDYGKGHFAQPTDVIFGDTKVPSFNSKARKIEKIKKHYLFKKPLYYYDIAIITVDEEIIFNSRIHPICRHTNAASYPDTQVAINVQGWGSTGDATGDNEKKMSQKTLTIWKNEDCDKRTISAAESNTQINQWKKLWMPNLTSDVLFCANNPYNPTVGNCNGDSGGPAIQTRFELIFFGHNIATVCTIQLTGGYFYVS